MAASSGLLQQSEMLHRRVRTFAQDTLRDRGVLQASLAQARFEALACDIASYQSGRPVDSWAQVISNAVPSDCFKFGHVFRFASADAVCAFRTSGTTAHDTGVHFMRDVSTYEQLSLSWGDAALGLTQEPAPVIVALAPWTGSKTSSSLGYMMQRMMQRFDGASVCERRDAGAFHLDDPLRWLVSERGVDVEGLRKVVTVAYRASTRVVLLATSFALVELLDALSKHVVTLPPGSTVMPTGGFKGRTRTIEPAEMHRELRRVFGDVDLVGEYGMTELTSQLYEAGARFGSLRGESGVYLEPPWLKVVPCDPRTLEPVSDGDVGLACFVDLGNVDSAVAIVTQDLVRRAGNAVQLLGRQPTAPLRGCSLAVEALLHTKGGVENTAVTRSNSRRSVQESSQAFDAGKSRVLELVDAVVRCKRDLVLDEPLMRRIAASGFMSLQGAKLALELALETAPSADEVDELVARSQQRVTSLDESTVWVVLSSTVFTAAHRAVALALSLSSRVKLKPSRRQPHFAQALWRASNGLFELVEDVTPNRGDVVMVFGSDESIEAIRKNVGPGVTVRGYGHGMGVAVITSGADLEQSTKGLALDMVLFEQQGCLSPRVMFLDTACDAAEFDQRLIAELQAWQTRVPPEQADAHIARAAWERRVAQTLGEVSVCGAGFIAHYTEQWCATHRLPLSSAPRSISVVHTKRPLSQLAPIAQQVTCVGFAGDEATARQLAHHLPGIRHVPLGMMQRPRFDGPVDLR